MKPINLSSDQNLEKPTHILVRILRGGLQTGLTIGILAGAWFGFQAIVGSKSEHTPRPKREAVFAASVVPANLVNVQPVATLYGTVSAGRRVELRSLVQGEVVWVNPGLAEGAQLSANVPVLKIDRFEYEGAVTEARAGLAEARASLAETRAGILRVQDTIKRSIEQLELARRDVARAQKLRASGSLTQKTLEDRQFTVSQREASVEQNKNSAMVEDARLSQRLANEDRLRWRLKQAERNLQHTTLTTPFTGIVEAETVEAGRRISTNDTVLTLYDPQSLEVRFTISDGLFGRLRGENENIIGRPVKVLWRLGSERVETFEGVISRVTPQIKANLGGVDVFASISKSAALRPGAFVELKVPDKTWRSVVRVPEGALYEGKRVFVVREGRMAGVEVSLKAFVGKDVLITGPFVGGDQIITTRIAEAGDGLKVKIFDANGEAIEPVGGGRKSGDARAGRGKGKGKGKKGGRGRRKGGTGKKPPDN